MYRITMEMFIDALRRCPDEWVHDPHCECDREYYDGGYLIHGDKPRRNPCRGKIKIKRFTNEVIEILKAIEVVEHEERKKDVRECLKKEKYKESGEIPHHFITVTFPKDHDPKDAWEKLLKCTKGRDLNGGIAGLEYYSDKAPDGGHLHFHLLAPKTKKYKPVTIREWCAKQCDVSLNFVDTGKANNTFANRVNYICGLKQTGKVDYCAKDRAWRDLLGLPRIYLEFTEELEQRFKYAIDFARA